MPEYGFSYKGQHSRDFGLVAVNVDPPILPPLEQKLVTVPGRAGSYRTGQTFKNREIPVSFVYRATSLAGLRQKARDIAAWLTPWEKEPGDLIFDDEPGKEYHAFVDGNLDPAEIWLVGRVSVKFVCPDPFAYATNQSIITIEATADAAGTLTVVNNGTWTTFPSFDVRFDAAASEWRVDGPGGFVRVVWNFLAGDRLFVDLADGSVTINGTRRVGALDMGSTLFALDRGNNPMTFIPWPGFTGWIRWTERWL